MRGTRSISQRGRPFISSLRSNEVHILTDGPAITAPPVINPRTSVPVLGGKSILDVEREHQRDLERMKSLHDSALSGDTSVQLLETADIMHQKVESLQTQLNEERNSRLVLQRMFEEEQYRRDDGQRKRDDQYAKSKRVRRIMAGTGTAASLATVIDEV